MRVHIQQELYAKRRAFAICTHDHPRPALPSRRLPHPPPPTAPNELLPHFFKNSYQPSRKRSSSIRNIVAAVLLSIFGVSV